MRTTIEIPDDLHRIVVAVARDRRQTLSQAVSAILRDALAPGAEPTVSTDPTTGWPVVRLGRTITMEDVRSLEDDA
jgi:hypothetical protein